jgi:hypothetical protein
MDPKTFQQIADALTALASTQHAIASTQTLMSYTLIVLTVGMFVCFAILGKYTVEISRIARDIHRQTTELLRGRE